MSKYPVYRLTKNSSKQRVFDAVVRHLIEQGVRSFNGAYCKNRIGDLACAQGCLMTDKQASRNIIGASKTICSWNKRNGWMIADLQSIHDASDPKCWREELRKLADEHGLDWNFDE
jgi:hypothetical protein